jgi:hypothetical protein
MRCASAPFAVCEATFNLSYVLHTAGRERKRMVSILACKSPCARLFGIESLRQGRSVTVIIKISNLKHRADRASGIQRPLLRKGARVSLLLSRADRSLHRANVSLLLPIGSFLFLISGSRAVYYYVNCYQAAIIKLIVSRTTTGQKPIRSAEFLDPPSSRCSSLPFSRAHHRRKINSVDKRAFSSAWLDFMSASIVFRRAPSDSVSSVFTPRSLIRFPNGRNSHHYVNYPRHLRARRYPYAAIAIIKLIGLNTR